ncbi:hypothetical protein A3K73_08620 [Candidatus Pacearchaeota archaeon RBG_13_36_9]|nr:MAG: hypothetical protein A3K73_08620 [Candidatus Pacearchaeota archaeon RBG_13_36_9]
MDEQEDILAEADQEKRIEMVLTDAYGEDEMQEAFCCYLGDYIKFPFEAKIKSEENSRKFTVLRFTSITPHRVVCEIEYGEGIKSRMPLTEIEPIDKDSSNNIVINDYLKFINEDYE